MGNVDSWIPEEDEIAASANSKDNNEVAKMGMDNLGGAIEWAG